MKIVYVDMDSVLVNFQSGIDSLTDEQRQTFKDDLDDVPGIFSKNLTLKRGYWLQSVTRMLYSMLTLRC